MTSVRGPSRESQFEAVFHQAAVGIARMRWPGQFEDVNQRFCDLLGYSADELRRMTFADIVHPDDFDAALTLGLRFKESAGEAPDMEARYLRSDGSLVWVNATVSVIPSDNSDVSDAIIVVQDISHQKRTVEDLRQARRDWENIFQAIGHPTVILETEQRIVAANRATYKMTGAAPESLLGKSCFEVFHGPHVKSAPPQCPFVAMRESTELTTRTMELETIGGHFLVSCTPVLDDDGNLGRVIHIATDVTERKRIERSLAFLAETAIELARQPLDVNLYTYAAERLRRLVPEAITVVKRLDRETKELHTETLVGVDEKLQRAIARTGFDPKKMPIPATDSLLGAFDSGKLTPLEGGVFELTGGRISKADSNQLAEQFALTSVQVVGFTRGHQTFGGVAILTRQDQPIPDATAVEALVGQIAVSLERREAERALVEREEQLRQVQKMEAIGNLAGGIAHDFNNMLTAIIAYADELGDPRHSDEIREAASVIEDAALRAAELTRQLLGFARQGKVRETPVDVRQLLQNVITVLSRTVDRRITISQRLDPEPAVITGDANQLQQVLLNLGVNARDAIARAGEISFGLDLLDVDERLCSGPDSPRGRCVRISVADNGSGIAPEHLNRVFEPFFTTKQEGEGTGMGLAMAYGIIRNHGGTIQVETAVGRGTTFHVFLPASKVTLPAEAQPPRSIPVRGRGCVLVVDDEEIIRNLATAMLDRLGYSVLVARDGNDGLQCFRAHGNEIDLVVLDLIMPGMGGSECFLRLRELNPKVRVLFSSGYIPDDAVTGLLRRGEASFINKPFVIGELSRAIAEALERRRSIQRHHW